MQWAYYKTFKLESCLSDDDWHAVQLNSLFLLDSGLSFSDVLLYSHEWDLLSFELLIFLVIDLVSHNYTLATIITFLLSKASKCWTFTNNLWLFFFCSGCITYQGLAGEEELRQKNTYRWSFSHMKLSSKCSNTLMTLLSSSIILIMIIIIIFHITFVSFGGNFVAQNFWLILPFKPTKISNIFKTGEVTPTKIGAHA